MIPHLGKLSIAVREVNHSRVAEKQFVAKQNRPRAFGHPFAGSKLRFGVGLSARVSARDEQIIPLQTRAMREHATRRGWGIVLQVTKSTRVLPSARRGRKCWRLQPVEIEVVLVWRLDRWGRWGSRVCGRPSRSWGISASVLLH